MGPATIPTPLLSLVTMPNSLHTLHVTWEPSISNVLNLQIRWTSLKELHLTSTPSDQPDPSLITSKVAELCPSLVSFKLELSCAWISTASLSPPPASHWTHLRNFDLTIADGVRAIVDERPSWAFWRIFQGMTAPALTNLSLKTGIDMTSSYPMRYLSEPAQRFVSHLPFENMIFESGCRISHLSLSNIFLLSLEGALTRSLELFPSLTSLTLMDYTNRIRLAQINRQYHIPHQNLTSFLGSLSSSANILPDITELRISDCQLENIEPIVSFAKARSNKLKDVPVDLGIVNIEEVMKITQIMSSADFCDSMTDLRVEKGVKVDWKWTTDVPDVFRESLYVYDRPYSGM
ncbi:hypothetical protein V5O48_008691 [Marasmius crinis-equi]|uniref:F-box domain-containing protein n=1 Tax=Marasmius crinis-equi TaxID=585013 RepID=A0ABR3FD69_9AGAR